MHSSRMRTGRSLTVCRSLLLGGWLLWGVSAPGGCVCLLPWGCLLPGMGCLLLEGCLLPGVSASRGVCSQGVSAWGVSAPRGCGVPACTEADTPPPVDRITDACKNITLATTSLRPVIITGIYAEIRFCFISYLINGLHFTSFRLI